MLSSVLPEAKVAAVARLGGLLPGQPCPFAACSGSCSFFYYGCFLRRGPGVCLFPKYLRFVKRYFFSAPFQTSTWRLRSETAKHSWLLVPWTPHHFPHWSRDFKNKCLLGMSTYILTTLYLKNHAMRWRKSHSFTLSFASPRCFIMPRMHFQGVTYLNPGWRRGFTSFVSVVALYYSKPCKAVLQGCANHPVWTVLR